MSGKRRNVAASVQGFATNPVDKALYDGEATEETDALFSALSSMKQSQPAAAIVPREGGAMELAGWQMTATGLIPPSDVSEAEYREFGQALLRLDTSMQWLIGDWINLGDNRQWGQTYTRLAEASGYEVRTLHDYAYVCRAVEFSIRIEKLSFGHHQVVAGMEPDEQAYWLGIAADEGLSIAKLRAAIKASQLPPPPAPTHDIDELNAQMPPGVTVEHVGTYNASNYHEMAGDLARSMANDQRPAGPPMLAEQPDEPAADGFDHEKFTQMQNAWSEARRVFEDVRTNHMAALRGVAGKATRRKTQQQIRDLIAHLHYIESEMEQ